MIWQAAMNTARMTCLLCTRAATCSLRIMLNHAACHVACNMWHERLHQQIMCGVTRCTLKSKLQSCHLTSHITAAKNCSDTACLLWCTVRGAYFEVLSNFVKVQSLKATEVKVEVEPSGWLPPWQLAGLHTHTRFSNAPCGSMNIGHWTEPQGVVSMPCHNCPEERMTNTITLKQSD